MLYFFFLFKLFFNVFQVHVKPRLHADRSFFGESRWHSFSATLHLHMFWCGEKKKTCNRRSTSGVMPCKGYMQPSHTHTHTLKCFCCFPTFWFLWLFFFFNQTLCAFSIALNWHLFLLSFLSKYHFLWLATQPFVNNYINIYINMNIWWT